MKLDSSSSRIAAMPIHVRCAWRRFALVVLAVAATAARAAAASVDGIPLHWTAAGSGAQTLVLVHGWTCDDSSWSGQVPALASKYRVITLDLPGHGKSGKIDAGRFSMDLFARAVEAVRAEAGAERIVLVGHSMGTPVIREYAKLYPHRVAALVLVDGVVVLGAPPRPGIQPAQPPVADNMRGPNGAKNRETMIRGMFTPATPQAIQDHVLRMMLAAPEATAYGAMVATFDPKIWTNDVMTMPVLGLFADKSALGNPETTKKLFPNYQHHEIPGTGHFLMMEKPREFNALLTAFVDALPKAPATATASTRKN
jgi:pimeloyl-ACP methyl ester carboxylesterase